MFNTLRKCLSVQIVSEQNGHYLVDYLIYYGLSLLVGYLVLTGSEPLSLGRGILFVTVTIVVSLPMKKVKQWLASKLTMDHTPFFQVSRIRQKKWARKQNEAGLSFIVSLAFVGMNMVFFSTLASCLN